ncbi:MAG: DNA polymerase III subunit gamma/tau [Kiritimatiellae bacterium]|nr:DNA polymerase III subunit gamma/tau [Kiritimatiellia bacterium]
MAYEVLARKWRPQQFDDVVGQQHVTQTLKNAIESKRIAHAYLFVGPRGIGKTSVARIFAKALNCATGLTVTPCDACDSCREIMAGTNLDVLEIDGASNNGVDQVRDLRDNVKYAAARGPYKIYIIDEVHMLTPQAFNALLKTLEEPPPHVKFVFATTEPQKILATILSRCQRFDLRRIPAKQIVERLQQIAKAEDVQADDDALLAIARGADGGLRDATSALDQLISFRGRQIAEEDVLAVFGLVARTTLEELAGAVLAGDIPRLLRILADLDERGKDMQRLVLELLEHFRDVLIVTHMSGDGAIDDWLVGRRETLEAQAGATDTERLLRITDVLIETENRLRYALSKRALLETALIRCAHAAQVVSLEEIMGKLERLRKAVPGARRSVQENLLPETAGRVSAHGVGAARARERGNGEPPAVDADRDLQQLTEAWHTIIEKVNKTAPLSKGCLVDAKPVAVMPDKVVVGFDPEFAQQMKRMDNSRNVQALQKVFAEVLNRPVSVEFQLMEGGVGVELPSDNRPRQEESDSGAAQEKAQEPAPPKGRHEWLKEPAVRKTLEMFNGNIIDVRE